MQAIYVLGGLLIGISTTAINMRGYAAWGIITLLGVAVVILAVYWERRGQQ